MAGALQGLLVVLTRGQPSGNAAPALTGFIVRPVLLGAARHAAGLGRDGRADVAVPAPHPRRPVDLRCRQQ